MSKPESDRELIEKLKRLQAGDHTPLPELLADYQPLLARLAATYFLPDGDRDDLLQEATIAFYRAILSYDTDRPGAFTTYAATVVTNHLLDCIKAANAKKQEPLNAATPIEETVWTPAEGRTPGGQPDTLDVILAGELAREVAEQISTACSPLEQAVLIRHLRHGTVAGTAKELGVSSKTVENALYRARQKLKGLFSGHEDR